MNFYNCKSKKVFKFNIENEIKDIYCGNQFILLKCNYYKIFIINEFGIHKLKYYNKNGIYKIDNLCVRYNEIFILLNHLKGEQLLLRYSPSNENNILNINYEYYERLYKINLKKKIKLIYSTSSYCINGIFFEIECDEKERLNLEMNKDKIFTLINRDYKDKKISFEKIKDLNEEEKYEFINMKNNNDNNWDGIKRNYRTESNKLIENLKKRNRNFSIEKFFENSPLSDKNIGFLTSRNLSRNKFIDDDFSEDEIEKRKKRKEYLKNIKNMSKKIEEDEIKRLKKEKYDKLRKKLIKTELYQNKLKEEELRKKLEEEELRKKLEEEELRKK